MKRTLTTSAGVNFRDDFRIEHRVLFALSVGFTSKRPIAEYTDINELEVNRILGRLKKAGMVESSLFKSYDPALKCQVSYNKWALTDLGKSCL